MDMFLKLKNKLKSKKQHLYVTPPEIQFKFGMNFIESIKSKSTKDEQLLLLDFFIDTIKNDLQSEFMSHIFFNKQEGLTPLNSLIPHSCYNANGEYIEINDKSTKIIKLKSDTVFVRTWVETRLFDSLKLLAKTPFRYDEYNHFGYYYNFLDFALIYNGNHSITAGVYYKKGEIELPVCLTEKLFPHVYATHDSWCNAHNDEIIEEISDFRVSLIYEASKLKYKLKYNI